MRTVHARKSINHHNPAPSATPSRRADIDHRQFTDRIRGLLETRRVLTELLGIRDELSSGLWDQLWNRKKLERLRRCFEREAYEEAIHGHPTWAGPDRDAAMVRIFDSAGLYFPVAAAANPIPSTPSALQLEVVR